MKNLDQSWDDEQLNLWSKKHSERWGVEPASCLIHLECLWGGIAHDSIPRIYFLDRPLDLVERFHSVFIATRDLLRPWADKKYIPKFLLDLLGSIRSVYSFRNWDEEEREVIACCVLAYDLYYSFEQDTSIALGNRNFTDEKGWKWKSACEFELDLLDLPEIPPIPTYYPETGDISEILAFLDVIFEIHPDGELLNIRLS